MRHRTLLAVATLTISGCGPDAADGPLADLAVTVGDAASSDRLPDLAVAFDGAGCPGRLSRCGDECVDLDRDPLHCGKCGVVCCPGAACSSGRCFYGCQPHLVLCQDEANPRCQQCTNLRADRDNCGQCGMKCALGERCEEGQCRPDCVRSEVSCGGRCIDLASNVEHCGGCGKACPPKQACIAGLCGCKCVAPLKSCRPDCICHDVGSDAQHCGGCNQPCPMVAHGAPACSMGACVLGVCEKGYGDCDGDSNNGCEVELAGDARHCAKCDAACAQGSVCMNGVCVVTCGAPRQLCNGNCVDVNFNPAHCGGCGKACPPIPHGIAGCTEGVCDLGTCERGYSDCDRDPKTGCESNPLTDGKNCGGCGQACQPHEGCCLGVCLDPRADAHNCGLCGRACAPDTRCCNAVCVDPKLC